MENAENLFSQIEDRLKAFGVRIAECANLSSKVDRLEALIEKFVSSSQEVEKSLSLSSQEHLKKLEEAEKFSSFLEKRLSGLEDFLKRSTESLEKRVLGIDEAKNAQSSLDVKINSALKEIKDIRELFKEFWRSLSEVKPELEKLKGKDGEVEAEVGSVKKGILRHEESLSYLFKLFDQVSKQTDSLKKSHETLNDKIAFDKNESLSYLSGKLTDVRSYVDSKFDSIQVPDVSLLVTKKEIDELKHLIAVSSLDAKNAASKASNMEMQFQILAKKIEGIQIQLRAQELAQS